MPTPLPYIREQLKGGAVVQFGELAIGETEEGVVIEPEVETLVADGADQLPGAAGVFVVKGGFQVRATVKRFTAELYAAALGLTAPSEIPTTVEFSWPEYLPQHPLTITGKRADGQPCVWTFPAVSVLPSAGVTLSRTPAGVPIVWKVLVDPENTDSFGKMVFGEL